MTDTRRSHVIEAGARRIQALHERIREALPARHTPAGRKAWEAACAEFHAQYDALAFPGGYEAGLRRIQAGDAEAIEAALVFLEQRPYFFRSQYMPTKLSRLLKRAALTGGQAKRFEAVRALREAARGQPSSTTRRQGARRGPHRGGA
jgi:hypothetical protein